MAYLTSYNDAIESPINHKVFGWINGDKSYIVGDREITLIETRYCPPSDEMIPYVASMQSKGDYAQWYVDLCQGGETVYDAKLTAVSLALGAVMMPLMTDDSYLINFVGNKNWQPLLYWINSIFGDNFRLTGTLDKDKVKLFKGFPITCIGIDTFNRKELENLLKQKHSTIISVSDNPVSFNHPRILNIQLPETEEVITGSLNQGVATDVFVKRAIAYGANKNAFWYVGADFWEDVISVAYTAMELLSEHNKPKLLQDVLKIHRAKNSPLINFLDSNRDYTLIHDRVIGYVAKRSTPIKDCKGDVYIRYEPNTKLLFVVKVPFRDYCKKNNVNFEQELLDYTQSGALVDMKSRMMNGRYVETLYLDTTKLLGFDETQFINGKDF